MKRQAIQSLIDWMSSPIRCPLLIRGARQVGKTHLIINFGKDHFKQLLVINFEQNPEYKACFQSREPDKILALLEALSGVSITPGEALLFLDEIQECPEAILALRYFKELMPELHVIGAGSLLEFVLNDADFRMPVGRVQFLYLNPLNFYEFLQAAGHEKLLETLKSYQLHQTLEPIIHEKLLKLVREYFVLGGMPAVLNAYFDTKSYLQAQEVQTALLGSYRLDFGKYAKYTQHLLLETLFRQAPQFITQWVKYSKIEPDLKASTIREALNKLTMAGLIYPIYRSSACGLPLTASLDLKKFKLLFLDIGLANRTSLLTADLLLSNEAWLVNDGALAEQFVGQELLALQPSNDAPSLFFWCREAKNSQAEVDYLLNTNNQIFPIEVKAGSTGRLKSLQLFMEEKKSPLGVRIWAERPSLDKNIFSIPFYLIQELPRLISSIQ